jgi:hypothetical protein
MRNFVLAAVAATVLSTAAEAAVTTTFTPGGASPSSGFVVIDTFDTLDRVSNVSGTVITQSGSNDNGAQPANSVPFGTNYLSVLGGGSADVLFGRSVGAFQFDWGSIDDYNTLTIFSSIGDIVIVPGSDSFPNAADGNRFLPGTNGRFTVTGTAGETFTGIRLASSQNSFEIDNLAVVPEPATWALLISGFGLVGAAMRRHRGTAVRVSA